MVFGLFSSPVLYKGQDYAALRKEHQDSGHLYIDNQFPPDDKSLGPSGGKGGHVEWKRPKDIVTDPKLFVGGTESGDVTQGSLGNCWFVASCSCLAQEKEVWQKVIPDHKDQEWDAEHPEKYCGIFHFNFWRYGEWIDVVIDDFLPTVNGKLVYVHSKSKNEFWSALLEKAYAKLFGSYEALDGGELSEALEDFTGGVSWPINMVEENYAGDEEKRNELFRIMSKEMDRRSLMAAAIPATSADEMEATTDVGLVKGHAYGITAVKKVAVEGTGLFGLFNQEKMQMIRLRNPWGKCEWNGAFSDGSKEWEKIEKADRDKIGLTFDDDGEFWMLFTDYCKYFKNMSICRVVNTSFFSLHKKYYESVFHGEWKAPNRAGGCLNNKETWLRNPQYVFKITEDEDEDVLISLMQKSQRGNGIQKQTIGFTIMKVEENREYRMHKPQEIIKSSSFKNSRSIFLRLTLKRGTYVVLPCGFEPNQVGNYLFRVYTSYTNHCKELTEDKPTKGCAWCLCALCSCFWRCRYPQMVTRIKVIRATGLERQDKVGGADPYAIVHCEGQQYYTPVVKDTTNPEWGTSVILYRKNPVQKPIKVVIWNSNVIKDDYMGKHIFLARDNSEGKVLEVDLQGPKKQNNEKRPGKMWVEMSTNTDLAHF
ncbi:unnamed protein product [Owenia fusiformis]|uniref:Uncharacterized protein n=1 Tax=Owenia fusiformis TaxID=6347 RepID=A0A8J1UC86_OWEFU|nr:unnamed protein product [Owenia fusiformis]